MNLAQLIDQFELVTDTEEGFKKLRKVILKQAVRGLLTKRNSNDESAKKSLKHIENERQRLYDHGKIRKPKTIDPINADNIPHDLPESWTWCNLGDVILEIYGGGTPSKSNPRFWGGDIYWASVKDLDDDTIYLESTQDKITKNGISETKLVPAGNVIVCTRMGLGKINLNIVDTTINQDLKSIILPDELSKLYFYYYYKSLEIKGSGMTVSGIKQSELLRLPFALPSEEEQHRVVRNIETLFAQVDELEQKVWQDRQIDERLQVAVLDDLQRAETPEASRRSWQRLTDHFEQIYRKPEHIDQLKQAILNEAVRGRLVPQEPSDEPAEKLLERIKVKKQRLYEEGKIRKPKELPEITDEEIPFNLSSTWTWCRLGNMYHNWGNKTPDKDFQYIDVSSIDNKKGEIGAEIEVISPDDAPSRAKRIVKEGTVLYATVRPYLLNVAIYDGNFEYEPIASTAFEVIHPLQGVYNKYIYHYLRSQTFTQYVDRTMVGVAYPAVNKGDMMGAYFPLPPIEEQKRIVKKVEELFTWCDELKSTLSHTRQTDQRVLEALVKE